ncbi:MAG: GTPase, partial [Planctomycetota bacterium]
MIGDTIVALATAPGASARATLRISGPRAFEVAAEVFSPSPARARAQVDGAVRVRGRSFEAFALTMVGPQSFTGEDVVELHLPGAPVLARLLQERLLEVGAARGARAALPGEFTARACQNGRLDLAQAEGLLLLLHAQDQREALAAVQWLNGGLAAAARAVRARLQDLLALVEVGFDFDDMDTGAVAPELWQAPLEPLAAQLEELLAALPVQAPGGELLLVGRANAGKSSLVNALAAAPRALVADVAGTTRDLLRVEVAPGVHLWDAPGDLDEPGAADRAALELRERLSGRAAGLLVVLDATDPQLSPMALRSPLPWFGVVYTKCDLVAGPPPLCDEARARTPTGRVFETSARDLRGVEPLRAFLAR